MSSVTFMALFPLVCASSASELLEPATELAEEVEAAPLETVAALAAGTAAVLPAARLGAMLVAAKVDAMRADSQAASRAKQLQGVPC